MSQLRKLLPALCFCVPFTGIGQELPYGEVTQSPLRLYGDSVKFTANITVQPDKVFENPGEYVIVPELGDVKFDTIRIPSSQMGNAATTGITLQVKGSALFDEDMIGNDLEIEHEYVYKDGKKNKEFRDMDDLAECCVTTGSLVSLNGQYTLMRYDYTPARTTPLKTVAQFNFPQDISTLDTDEFASQVRSVGEYLKKYPDAKITVKGYASPEGPVERNKQLAQERAEVAKQWLTNALAKQGYKKHVNKDNIQTTTTTEDWDGLMAVLEMNDVGRAKRNEVEEILSRDITAQEKEKQMVAALGGMKAAEPYLMPLRRSTVIVHSPKATRSGFSMAQIDSVNSELSAGNIPLDDLKDVYNKEEYLQAAQRTDATSGKLSLLSSYYETYPSDTRVYSDLGALTAVDLNMLDMIGGDDALIGVGFDRDLVDIDGELDVDDDKFKFKHKYKLEDVDAEKDKLKIKAKLDEAEFYLVKAYKTNPDNFVVSNNMGAYYLSIGDYENAKKYLDESMRLQNSEGANYNMGVYHARMGDFQTALKHFQKANNVDGIEYNRGISYLMLDKNEEAMTEFQAFTREKPQYAIGHYLLAVAAARTDNTPVMLTAMQNAVTKESRLSDIAAEDLEFQDYWNDTAFKEASDDDIADDAK